MRITAVDFVPLNIPLDAPFKPAWLPETLTMRTATLVRLHTDEGITGYGWQGSRGNEVKAFGETKFFQNLIVGHEVHEIETVAKILTRFPGKMFGTEIAMWDALGKSAKMPIYKLLGGVRDKVMPYASTGGNKKPKEHATEAASLWDAGYHAIKIRIHNERIEDDVAKIKAVRDAVPREMLIAVDANQASPTTGPVWSYKRALKTAKELERLGVFWLEEPLHHEAHKELAMLRSQVGIYIAGAEDEVGIHRFRDILKKGCFDIIQPDVSTSGGLLSWRKVAAMAESMNTMIIPHSFDAGINLAAEIQAVASVPNGSFVECAMDLPALDQAHDKLLKTRFEVDKDGYFKVPQAPGLGIEVDEKAVEKYAVKHI